MLKSKRRTIPIIALCLILFFSFNANAEQIIIVLTDANPDFTITTGTTATVYGTAGANHVTIESGANVRLMNFPGSNIITIKADSSNFTVSRSGAMVTFQGTDGTLIKMPATKTMQTIIFNDLSKKLVISNNKVMLESDEVTLESAAIRPVAGIVELFINSENNQLSGFAGNAVEAKITIISDSQDNTFSFEIEDGPAGMAVSSEGVIKYTIQADAQVETSTPFKVRVFNDISNESVTLDGSIYVMKSVEIASGTVTAQGGTVTADAEGVSVEIPAGAVSQNVQVKIIKSQDGSGNNTTDFVIDGVINGTFNIHLPEPEPVAYNSSRSISQLKDKNRSSGYNDEALWGVLDNRWDLIDGLCIYKRFSRAGERRLPDNTFDYNLTQEQLNTIGGTFLLEPSVLISAEPKPEPSKVFLREAVLFIHGYTPGTDFGGGEDTWGDFPKMINNLGYIPFEFRWRTDARFEDVANDLGKYLSIIASKTNKKKVHIVAHSFGGILTRTVLQKLNSNANDDYSSYIASVTTLGTPHSGILASTKTLDGVTFPKGRDSWVFNKADQISVHEMGKEFDFVSELYDIFKVDPKEGMLAAELAKTVYRIPPGLPIQVGIGLQTFKVNSFNYITSTGDGLISYEGQRFHPNLTNSSEFKPLLSNDNNYGGKITEFILGYGDDDIHPNVHIDDPSGKGYSHNWDANYSSLGFGGIGTPEARVTDSTHASYIAVKNFLSSSPTPPGPTGDFTNSLGMTFNLISAGTFMMGSPATELGRYSNETQHQVTLTKSYYMQTTEVTQGQWKAVMGSNPSYFSSCGDNCPVEWVSWYDAQAFIAKLNQNGEGNQYRLPTEAEWEYAARAGTTTPFYIGSCLSTDQANYHGDYPLTGCSKGEFRAKTVAVGSFSPNNWGLYEMHGNVHEWCQDWYADSSITAVDPVGPESGSNRVIRGGSWYDSALGCRSAVRLRFSPSIRVSCLGFRLVCSAGHQ